MKVYHYDALTKAFKYSSDAHKDELESRRKGADVFLIPAHATDIEPSTVKEGEVSIFDSSNNKWNVKNDYRGKTFYRTDTQEVVDVEDPNFEPDSTYTEDVPADKYDEWENGKWERNLVLELTEAKSFKLQQLKDKLKDTMFDTGFDVAQTEYTQVKGQIDSAINITAVNAIVI